MAFKAQKTPIHGWLPLYKPSGITSAKLVAQVKKVTGAVKVGHAGTLDPLACGIVLVAFGEATKTVSYAMDLPKSYEFVVRWGEATDTDDAEGCVIKTSKNRPNEKTIRSILPRFLGETLQTPPVYSAIKINGERAYKMVRENKKVTLKPRPVHIKKLQLKKILDTHQAEFMVESGKGMYVRALGRDLALKLSTYGHIRRLARLAVGKFNVSNTISFEDFIKMMLEGKASIDALLKPIDVVLDGLAQRVLTKNEAIKISSGQSVSVYPIKQEDLKQVNSDTTVSAVRNGRLVALGKVSGEEIRPFRVFSA